MHAIDEKLAADARPGDAAFGAAPPAPAQRERLRRFNVDASVDVHCHCLPGLDDGPADLAEALALCRVLVADGVTHVVATPHQLGAYPETSAARIREAVADLQAALRAHAIPLAVVPGADVRVDVRLPALLAEDQVMSVADRGRHVLLEQPWEVWLPPDRLIEPLAALGVQPVLTHPERHAHVQRDPGLVGGWVEAGALVQVNAGSLCGAHGPAAEQSAWQLLRAGWVHLVASDAHDVSQRPPVLAAAIDRLVGAVFHATTRRLCLEAPWRLLEGERGAGS